MKKRYILLSILLIGGIANAQQNTNATKQPTAKEVKPKTFNVVNPNNYESSLVQGKLILNKKIEKIQNSNSFSSPSYTIISSNESSSLKEKPLEIKLSNQFFETVFLRATTEISDKSAYLIKFVQVNKISLNDEKGWIELIKFYNNL